jgi:hypothetical protein
MQSVVGISENLIQQYRALYAELNVPAYQGTLDRLRRTVFHPSSGNGQPESQEDADPAVDETESQEDPDLAAEEGEKGGAP